MRKFLLTITISAACFVSAMGFQYPLSKKEIAAKEVAESWLLLLDAEDYGESWEQLSPLAKKKIPKEYFETGLTILRTPLGKLKSRTFFMPEYMKPPKGHPKREQLLLRFMSQFESRSILESVVTIHDKDGKWRVSTYMRYPPK